MKKIQMQELTAENFNDFGHIISSKTKEPMADNEEITYWGKVTQFQMGPEVSTGYLHVHKRQPVLKALERHKKTPEILVATEGQSVFCFAKASSGENEEIGEVKAILLKQGDAVVIHKGCWHWAGYPADCDRATLLVMFTIDTEQDDLEIKDLAEDIEVEDVYRQQK